MTSLFDVKGQTLTPLETFDVVSETVNYLTFAFMFSYDWAGLTKSAIFTKGDDEYEVALVNDAITADKHVNLSAGEWTLSVVGSTVVDAVVTKQITTTSYAFTVLQSDALEGEEFPPSVASQVYVNVNQATPQTFVGGIPKLAADRVIDHDNELADKKYVDDHTPPAPVHNDLGGLQGGSAGEYYHTTQAQNAALHAHSNKTALDAVSGTNTGDQDVSGAISTHNTDAGAHANLGIIDAGGYYDATTVEGALQEAEQDIIESGRWSGKYLYNGDIGLRRWFSKLASLKANGGIINVNVVGNSLVEGVEATGYTSGDFTKTFVGLLRSSLASRYGDVGFGFMPPYFPSFPGTSLTVFSSGWTNQTLTGVHSSSKETTTIGSYVTVTFTGTGAELFYTNAQNQNSKISVSIDGGSAVEYDLFYGLSGNRFLTIATGLTDGTHTAVITKINDTNVFRYHGLLAKKGTTGIRVNMMGRSAYNTTGMISSPNLQVQETITAWTPALTVLAHFCNDQSGQVALATYKANLQLMITRALMYGSVLLVPLGVWQTPTAGITEAQYYAALKELAVTNSIALLDTYNAFGASGTYSTSTLGLQNSAVHFNDAGNSYVADMILKAIDPL